MSKKEIHGKEEAEKVLELNTIHISYVPDRKEKKMMQKNDHRLKLNWQMQAKWILKVARWKNVAGVKIIKPITSGLSIIRGPNK